MCKTMAAEVLNCYVFPFNNSNTSCPTCRTKVTKATDDFRANSLLEIYLNMNPSKARPAEEIQELDAAYKPGDRVALPSNLSDTG